MLLDASRSHDIGILVGLRDKGHKGLLRFQFCRVASEAAGREAQTWPSGEHRGNPRLALSLSEGLHCLQSWLCFVLCIIAYRAIAGLPLPVSIQVRNPRPAAWKSQKIPEVCIRVLILPDNHDFAGSIRAGS